MDNSTDPQPDNDSTNPPPPVPDETAAATPARASAPVPPAPIPGPVAPGPVASGVDPTMVSHPATEYPPPVAYAPPVSAARPAGSGRVVGIVIGIVAAVVLVLGGLGVAIFFLVQNAISALDESGLPGLLPVEQTTAPQDYPEKEPLLTGEPGPAVAVDPTNCPDECFTIDAFAAAVLSDETYAALGVPDLYDDYDYPNSTAQREFLYAASAWEEQDGSPEECFPVTIYSPVAAAFDGRPVSGDDPVGFSVLRESPDLYSSLSASPRLFTDSATAESHMAQMLELVAGCSSYDLGTGTGFWTADVTPMPALSLPASVAAVGWVEDSPFGRYYAADLQRGNLVVRATLYTDGSITEAAWREYLATAAQSLADLAA